MQDHVEPSREIKLFHDEDENEDNSVNDQEDYEEELKDGKITEIQDKPFKSNSFMIHKFSLNKLLQK